MPTTSGSLEGYRERRDALVPALEAAGFRVHRPAGAYYVMTDIRDLTDEDDVAFARRLIADPGVAAVPGLVVLLAARARPDQAPVRVPEAARDAQRRRRPAVEACPAARADARAATGVRRREQARGGRVAARQASRTAARRGDSPLTIATATLPASRAGSTRRSRGRRGAGTGRASSPRRRTRSRPRLPVRTNTTISIRSRMPIVAPTRASASARDAVASPATSLHRTDRAPPRSARRTARVAATSGGSASGARVSRPAPAAG